MSSVPADPLPGLELSRPGAGPLESSVREAIAALDAEQRVGPADVWRIALALELCQVLEHKRVSGRTSTYSNDARVLKELLDDFKPAAATETDEMLRAAMAEWSAIVTGQAVPDARG